MCFDLGLGYGNQGGNLARRLGLALLVVLGFLGHVAPALDRRGRWAKVDGWLSVDALGFKAAVVNAGIVASTL